MTDHGEGLAVGARSSPPTFLMISIYRKHSWTEREVQEVNGTEILGLGREYTAQFAPIHNHTHAIATECWLTVNYSTL